METTESSGGAVPDRPNVVRQYVVHQPDNLPAVEVCLAAATDGVAATWAQGQLRMHTEHEDGSRTFTAQYRLRGRLLVDNFSRDRVRGEPAP